MKHKHVMRFSTIVITSAVLLCTGISASSQMTLTGAGKTPAAAASFTGPGDIVSGAKAWYGMRAYSAADRGNALVNVCNVADVACADLSSDPTTGALVISTIGGSSCSVVTCTIKTMYDRSGNGNDVTQATIANRPTLTVSCFNSLPCAKFLGTSSQTLATAATIGSVASPYSYSVVVARTGDFGNFNVFTSGATNDQSFAFNNGANQVAIYSNGGPLVVSATDNVVHAMQAVTGSGTSGDVNVDGTRTTGNAGTAAFAGILKVGSFANAGGRFMTGNIMEVGIWPTGFTSGNETSMCHNQFTYWGTATSC